MTVPSTAESESQAPPAPAPRVDLSPPWSKASDTGLYFSLPYGALPPQIKARRQQEGVPGDGLEFKSLPYRMELKADGDRRVKLWIARMGEDFVDDGGDMIMKGAFDQTIEEDGPSGQNLIKYFHDHSILLGPCVEIEAKKDGVVMLGAIDEDPALDRFLAHAKSGAVAHGSFGYSIKEAHRDNFKGKPIRAIVRLKCWEGSQVVWPMNRAATLLEAKSARLAAASALLPKGLKFADTNAEAKNLWGVASVVRCLAEIDSSYQEIARILADDAYWGSLSAEDRSLIDSYLDQMVANGKAAEEKRLQISGGTVPAAENHDAASAAMDRLLASLRGAKGLFAS